MARKFSYWVSECLDDSKVYNLRGTTKREVEAVRKLNNGDQGHEIYGPVKKVTVEFEDTFELILNCLCEGGGWWEVE